MILVLPYPDSRLLPNRKTDRWTKAEVTREARWRAKCEAINLLNSPRLPKGPHVFTGQCRMTYTFYPKTRKVADCDSLVRACKPFIDGIVDAGILSSDGWECIIERTQRLGKVDKLYPRTEIEIKEAG